MSDYLSLSIQDKIKIFVICLFYGEEQEIARRYINALLDEDTATISELERWGQNPRHLVSNYWVAQKLSSFGFPILFDERGEVIDRIDFSETEVIEIGPKKGPMMQNQVKLGRSPNGKWAFATTKGIPNEGSSYGLNLKFCKPYNTRNECLKKALAEIIEYHTGKDLAISRQVIADAKQKMYEAEHGRLEQATLF